MGVEGDLSFFLNDIGGRGRCTWTRRDMTGPSAISLIATVLRRAKNVVTRLEILLKVLISENEERESGKSSAYIRWTDNLLVPTSDGRMFLGRGTFIETESIICREEKATNVSSSKTGSPSVMKTENVFLSPRVSRSTRSVVLESKSILVKCAG